MSSRMSGANSAYPPDGAAKSGRRAVALAELSLWFLSPHGIGGKEIEASGFARSTDRRQSSGAASRSEAIARLRQREDKTDVFKDQKGLASRQLLNQLAYVAICNVALCRPGGHGGAAAPVPIPNTAVKRPSADGTSS